ncbi:RNA polymerase II-associated 3 isoform X1 [Olea europaea subsp. europaea]|uniref:RNA polymerase II-associated 3 isoform X1 n=1 Tax=Olea europaea subsp. europaea TaxID=158383 RepID=A0A8S0US94_OLEEU|nr:RNA polymerase II-associated 3 isoform X1 [Olea europaea subsp. europaea]
MAKVPSKHTRFQDFGGILNNLQDWESSFTDRDNKLKSQSVGKNKLDLPAQRHSMNSASQHSNGTGVNVKQPVGRSGLTVEESVDANSEKELECYADFETGNEFFKQKKFNEAIDCYSRSIAFSPTAVAYANMAMAYIKIRRFQEAENDSTEALNLDDRYIKAYSRRATARKELGKLKESIDDAAFALRLEPHNQEIKKQHVEVKSLLEKEIIKKTSRAAAGFSRGVQRAGELKVDKSKSIHEVESVSTSSPPRGVDEMDNSKDREQPSKTSLEVESSSLRTHRSDAGTGLGTVKECICTRKWNLGGGSQWQGKMEGGHKSKHNYGKQELKASVQELAARAANLAKAEAAKHIAVPDSAYQFEVS